MLPSLIQLYSSVALVAAVLASLARNFLLLKRSSLLDHQHVRSATKEEDSYEGNPLDGFAVAARSVRALLGGLACGVSLLVRR